jgi:hypothetical protein
MDPAQPLDSAALARAEYDLRQKEFDYRRTFDIAQVKARRSEFRLSLFALGVPLLIAALTYFSSARDQRRAAAADLQLKTAELILAGEGPYAARQRLTVIRALFGDRLPPAFDTILTLSETGAPGRERRLALLQLLAQYPNNREQILKLADTLFPNTAFIQQLMPPPKGR